MRASQTRSRWLSAGGSGLAHGPRCSALVWDSLTILAQVVFATKPGDDAPNEGASRRPDETALPLVARLRLKEGQFDTSIKQDQAMQLVETLQKLSGVVLVCWEHKALAKDILPLIPLKHNSPPVPTQWNDDRFDVVLRFDRAADDTKFTFRELYPRLLSGDSDKPLGKEDA